MLFYKTMEKLCSWIFSNVVPLVIQLITLFLTEIIPLYRKPGIFSEIFCYFQLFTSNTLGRKYPQAAQETRKNKKAETPCSPHNVPTSALGSPYFHKDALKANSFCMGRHQGLKLTVFSCHRLLHRFFIVVSLA